jgi:hypothetical protein
MEAQSVFFGIVTGSRATEVPTVNGVARAVPEQALPPDENVLSDQRNGSAAGLALRRRRAGVGAPERLPVGSRKREPECAALAGNGFDPDPATVFFNDLADHR